MNIDLTINTDLARKILTGFLKSEITRAGFGRAVIGLSGGIDSALSCALAVEALGPRMCWQCECRTSRRRRIRWKMPKKRRAVWTSR